MDFQTARPACVLKQMSGASFPAFKHRVMKICGSLVNFVKLCTSPHGHRKSVKTDKRTGGRTLLVDSFMLRMGAGLCRTKRGNSH